MTQVLIIDDDKNYVSALAAVVRKKGYDVEVAERYQAGLEAVKKNTHDIIFVDMMLPDGDGMDVIRNAPDTNTGRFYLMTGYPSVDTAVNALTGRAVDYLIKPVTTRKIESVLTKYEEDKKAGRLRKADDLPGDGGVYSAVHSDEPFAPGPDQEIVGDSAPVRKMLHDINRLAVTRVSVLVQGESGTGKELVAQKIHALSKRKGQLHAINCGAIPRELIGSELFGHEKGSFTGANKQRKGIFERASGGTLFLDEITEMPIDMQVNLLRVLETEKFSRVGSHESIDVDVRIIAATNYDPIQAIREGKLREDLYFRLAEMPVMVPPLRNRGKDILVLAEYFLERLNEDYSANKTLDDQGKLALMKYSWPGNVRELSHALHRAFIVSDHVLDFSEIPDMVNDTDVAGSEGRYLGSTIAEMEKKLILETLAHFDNDKPRAAEVLGISLKTLYNRLNRYNRPKHSKLSPPSVPRQNLPPGGDRPNATAHE